MRSLFLLVFLVFFSLFTHSLINYLLDSTNKCLFSFFSKLIYYLFDKELFNKVFTSKQVLLWYPGRRPLYSVISPLLLPSVEPDNLFDRVTCNIWFEFKFLKNIYQGNRNKHSFRNSKVLAKIII